MNVVFDTKESSDYDDEIARRYHFPTRYLEIVSRAIGDWVVFRQPRAGGGSKAYFAVARVDGVDADLQTPGHWYARISEFLAFDQPVEWTRDGRYSEEALRNISDVSKVGVFLRGRSVRELSKQDFNELVLTGLNSILKEVHDLEGDGSSNPQDVALTEGVERRVVSILINRKVRDAAFRRTVCGAYGYRCAVTGLVITDTIGNAEVQAAHIWSVADGGPDTVQNGLALSGTVHWLFDRFLIALTDDFGLLVSPRVPPSFAALLVPQASRILLPQDRRLMPNLEYVRKHRKTFSTRTGC